MIVPALKVGKNEEDTRNSYYLCPEFAKGTLQILFVLDGKKTFLLFHGGLDMATDEIKDDRGVEAVRQGDSHRLLTFVPLGHGRVPSPSMRLRLTTSTANRLLGHGG